MTTFDFISSGIRTIQLETEALTHLQKRLDSGFIKACQLILECKGRVIVTGIGKSGHIARKIAATLASTGTPAFFIHPAEASHGDLGMLVRGDVVIAISNSGGTSEVVTLVPLIKRLGVPLIAMTGRQDSPITKASDAWLNIGVDSEACPLGLSPTTSTTVTLVVGDALAIALLEARGFTAEDFAFSHPGGALGRKLLIKVEDIMHTGATLPTVTERTSLKAALLEMSKKGFGMTTVINSDNELVGVFTDGDLRRVLDNSIDIHGSQIADVMTRNCKTVRKDILAAEAFATMESRKITALIVEDDQHHPIGVVHMHDILRAGII